MDSTVSQESKVAEVEVVEQTVPVEQTAPEQVEVEQTASEQVEPSSPSYSPSSPAYSQEQVPEPVEEIITGTVIVSPQPLRESCKNQKCTRVFLGGSIGSKDWQSDVANRLVDLPVYVFNPRRVDWNADWDTDVAADVETRKAQIEWGFEGQMNSDILLFNFDKDEVDPASLLELGTFCFGKIKPVVCCPPEFPYFLNVEFICKSTDISLFSTLDEAVAEVRKEVKEHNESLLKKMKQHEEFMKKLVGSDGKISTNALFELIGMMGMGDCCEHGECDEDCKDDDEDKIPDLECAEQDGEGKESETFLSPPFSSTIGDKFLKALLGAGFKKVCDEKTCASCDCGDTTEKPSETQEETSDAQTQTNTEIPVEDTTGETGSSILDQVE